MGRWVGKKRVKKSDIICGRPLTHIIWNRVIITSLKSTNIVYWFEIRVGKPSSVKFLSKWGDCIFIFGVESNRSETFKFEWISKHFGKHQYKKFNSWAEKRTNYICYLQYTQLHITIKKFRIRGNWQQKE